ncbi:MAG: 1-acyl-sn-glycerol-3-phosphate acyltransferase [Deltaproteobacteria bacterium]|nr:1-acyl-sn-glycerol-3-phosphate acyltransferase [Deltaproteobacteria bacterium]MBW2447795.1 1-acyl-sn-glycerol-3-phosphate acyltransferase [Deltaproteobacteria bacterium]
MVLRILSTMFWVTLTLSSIALFPVAVLIWAVTAPFDRRKVVLHQFTCFWGSLYTFINPAWPVKIVGREKIDRSETYVMVANHLSLLDILVLFRLFTHYKWVSKSENFRIPCIGWNMRLNRYIELRRGDRASVVEMMRQCERTLGEGSSIMMFPEGTRSNTGKMRAFKTGAFELALKSRRPILPLVVTGTSDALPKAGFVLQGRHPIEVTVLDTIPFEDFEGQSAEAVAETVRNVIGQHLGEKGLTPVAAAPRPA